MSEQGLSPEPRFRFMPMPKEGRGLGKGHRRFFMMLEKHLDGRYPKKGSPTTEAAVWAAEHGRTD